MYLLVDRSTSMSDQGKFSSVSSGINAFVTDSQAAGLDFGMQFFPVAAGGTCAGVGYSTPAAGWGALPGLASAVSSVLATTTPNGATPLEGVFNGLKLAGTQYLSTKPATELIAVVITDVTSLTAGGGCSNNQGALAAILAGAWPAVTTRFIGLPVTSVSMLNTFAQAGGSTAAEIVASPSAGNIEGALKRANRACRFAIPGGFALNKVTFSIGNQALSQVNSPGGCGSGHWFLQAGAAALCPQACDALNTDPPGTVKVQASCN
jgi:hypothetical protein